MNPNLARNATFTALDFETTGHVRNQRCLPWQLGLAEGGQGTIQRTHMLFLCVPADFHFNPYAPGRWAEKRELLAASPSLQESWPELAPWLSERYLVSHNAPVERKMLQENFPLHAFPLWLDTLKIARTVYPRMKSYALEALLDSLNLTSSVEAACPELAPHDALYDAVGCLTLLYHILSLDGWSEVSCDYLASL